MHICILYLNSTLSLKFKILNVLSYYFYERVKTTIYCHDAQIMTHINGLESEIVVHLYLLF